MLHHSLAIGKHFYMVVGVRSHCAQSRHIRPPTCSFIQQHRPTCGTWEQFQLPPRALHSCSHTHKSGNARRGSIRVLTTAVVNSQRAQRWGLLRLGVFLEQGHKTARASRQVESLVSIAKPSVLLALRSSKTPSSRRNTGQGRHATRLRSSCASIGMPVSKLSLRSTWLLHSIDSHLAFFYIVAARLGSSVSVLRLLLKGGLDWR